jgi:hypothetical protein
VALLQASPAKLLQLPQSAVAASSEESEGASEDDGNKQLHLSFDMDDASSSSSGSYSGSQLTELEDLEEIEDLLLQELFVTTRPGLKALGTPGHKRQQQQQQQAMPARGAGAVPPVPAADSEQAAAGVSSSIVAAAHTKPQQQQSQETAAAAAAAPAGPQLLVELCSIQGLTSLTDNGTAVSAPLTAVIKSAGQTCCRLDVSSLLQQNASSSADASGSSSSCHCPCSAIIIGPSCLAGPLLATDKPCLAVELWGSSSSCGSSVPAAAGSSSYGELLGIVRVPLQQQQQQQQQQLGQAFSSSSGSATQLEQPCFAAGTFPVYDVLRGKHAGSLELRVLLAESQQQPDADAAAEDAAAADEVDAAAVAAASAVVVAVRHVIEVTVHSASHLPDAERLQAGDQQLPESRFMRYCFPGEWVCHPVTQSAASTVLFCYNVCGACAGQVSSQTIPWLYQYSIPTIALSKFRSSTFLVC